MLNTIARDENIPEVERYIHTINERACATISTLPFEKYPHHLIVEKYTIQYSGSTVFCTRMGYILHIAPGQL